MTDQKPSIGRIVTYYQGDGEAGPSGGVNGTREHPAVITRVWSDSCVNLIVLFDASAPDPRTSACELPDSVFADGVHCTNSGWFWPKRV